MSKKIGSGSLLIPFRNLWYDSSCRCIFCDRKADIVIIAVNPSQVPITAKTLSTLINPQTIVMSIAAGVLDMTGERPAVKVDQMIFPGGAFDPVSFIFTCVFLQLRSVYSRTYWLCRYSLIFSTAFSARRWRALYVNPAT